jgi:hypothetical protein
MRDDRLEMSGVLNPPSAARVVLDQIDVRSTN